MEHFPTSNATTESLRESIRELAHSAAPYVRTTGEILAEALWPTRCAVCDAPGRTLCESCARNLAYIDWNRACPRCGAPFGTVQCCECNPVMLSAAERQELPFERLVSAVSYNDAAKAIASTFKDKGERRLAQDMACAMSRCIPPEWLTQNAVITFVPASKAAFRKRGFDHAELLCKALAEILEIECTSLLARPRSFDQRALSRKQRAENMKGRLELLPEVEVAQNVIVVDDVCTTGATLFAACDALAQGGAQLIRCVTFARV